MASVDTWTGQHATALRRALRMSKEAYAAHLGVAVGTVSYWAKHPDAVCTPVLQHTLDTALARADGDARERFHTAVSVPTATTAPVELWQITDVLTRTPISMSALEAMERAVFEYSALYPVTGPDAMLTSAERQMARLGEALTQPIPVAVRRRVVRLLGLLAGVVGHLYVDLGAGPRARQLFELGRLASTEAEDHDLAAWIIATDSIAAFYDDQPDRAVELLAEADASAARASSPRRRAWITAMQARALAAVGRADDAWRALDRAHGFITEALDPPNGNDFFDTARLDGVTGSTLLLLRDTTRATTVLGSALDRRAPTDIKGRALLTLDLAACRVVDGEPGEATRLVGEALDVAHGAIVRPIAVRATQVRATMKSWGASRPVAELDERLTDVQRQARKTT
jgi:hypothetical protein